jgi:integrase
MEGLGSIRKRPGSRFYWIFFHVAGKRFSESSKSVRKADAQALLWKRLQEYRLVPGLVTRSTVDEVLDHYLQDAELRGIRALDAATRATARAREFLGHELAAEIDPRRIHEYQQRLRDAFKPATVNQAIGFLRAAFKHAARSGMIGRTPEFPRKLPERNVRQGFIEHADYVAILAELEEWARDPFRLAYHTGWRRNEVLSLQWDEVDLEAQMLRLSPERSKNGEGRPFPFLGEMSDIFSRRLAVRVLGLPVVFHRNGRAISSVSLNVWFRRACVIAGRDKLIHDCRRTAYRRLLRIGCLEKTAREMVGWRSRAMADRYNVTSESDYETVRELYAEHMRRKAAEAEWKVVAFEKGKP